MDTTEKVTNLISVTERLCAILESENLALQQRNSPSMQNTLDAKDRLSRAYEKLTQALTNPPGQLKEVADVYREKIKALAPRLADLVQKNAESLRIEIQAHECVIKHVAAAAKQAAQPTNAYNRSGMCAPSTRHAAMKTSTIAVNTVL